VRGHARSEARSLYQARTEHAGEAGKIFALMGDVVEPRREFIQDNALKVGESRCVRGAADR
jgi:DNA gyrase/topoisomerase IV subunit B